MANEVFLKRLEKSRPHYAGLPLIALVGVSPQEGEIGIEIEVEGNKFPKSGGYQLNDGDEKYIPKQWKYTQDGSLRGQDNAEYVLTRPVKFDEVDKAVKDLWEMFSKYGTVLTESNRTSVHVHLNVQKFHLNRLCSFVSMYFVIEELLTEWCGDHRVGNLFCLRGRDAPAIVRKLKEFFQRDGYDYTFSSGMHYAGLNPSAIHKFGSIELRSLRGVNDPQVILDWVSVLQRLYLLSAEFKDPREVVSGFSGNGPIAWLQNILGDKFSTVMQGVPYTTDEVRDMLYNGIRLAQDLCYCRDWGDYKEVELKENPFGMPTTMPISVSESDMSFAATGYPYEIIIDKLHEVKDSGHIGEALHNVLMQKTPRYIETWLISNGHLPELESEEPEIDEWDNGEDYDEDDE